MKVTKKIKLYQNAIARRMAQCNCSSMHS